MNANSQKKKGTGSIIMDLYIELHTVQNTLEEGKLELEHNHIIFKEITKEITKILGCGRENEVF